MCRALITIVLGTAMLGALVCASAHNAELNLPAKLKVVHGAPPSSECLAPGTACKSTTLLRPVQSPPTNQIVPLTYRGADRMASVTVQQPAAVPLSGNNPNWRSVTGVLSTLALIGTIALRRSRSGKL